MIRSLENPENSIQWTTIPNKTIGSQSSSPLPPIHNVDNQVISSLFLKQTGHFPALIGETRDPAKMS